MCHLDSHDRRTICAMHQFGRMMAALLIVFSGGCATLRDRNPIDEDVIIARQLSQQGVDARMHGDWDSAEERFRSAIKYCPKDHTARTQYAECLWRRGASEEAMKELEAAIDLSDGTDVDSIARLGEMARQLGDLGLARRMAEKALRTDAKNVSAWKLKAALLSAEGNLQDALAAYHRAQAYAPDDQAIQQATAKIYLALRRPDRAVAVLDRVLVAGDESELQPELYRLHGLALAQIGREMEALESLTLATRMTRQPDADLLADLGELQMRVGNYAEARQNIDNAFRIANSPQRQRLQQLQARLVAKLNQSVIR